MANYKVKVGATSFGRAYYEKNAEVVGTFVIAISNDSKEKLVDGEEFSQTIELNDNEFNNYVKQKSDLKGWKIAIEVGSGTTIMVGKIIGVVLQEVGDVERTIATCLMSNGAYLVLTIDNDKGVLSGELASGGLVGGSGKSVAFSDVAFNSDNLPKATLTVSETDYATLVGEDDVVLFLNFTSGETLTLQRTSHDENGSRFFGTVGHINTEFTATGYLAIFVDNGENIIGEVYEIDLFEGNVEIPNGVEPIQLATAKIFGDYYTFASGITATVDDNNKTIDIVLE